MIELIVWICILRWPNPRQILYVDPPSNEVCYTSSGPETIGLRWDTDGPGPAVFGYHAFVRYVYGEYEDGIILDAGLDDRTTFNFTGIQSLCFQVRGYVVDESR